MEATLVTLMDRFRNGDLRASAYLSSRARTSSCTIALCLPVDEPTMRAMRLVRERQEHLARLHFNLYADDALTE